MSSLGSRCERKGVLEPGLAYICFSLPILQNTSPPCLYTSHRRFCVGASSSEGELRRRYSGIGGDRVLSNCEGGSRGSVSGLALLSKTELQMY